MAALATVLDEDRGRHHADHTPTHSACSRRTSPIAAAVHQVGGLLYYDGANLNAILGVVRPW